MPTFCNDFQCRVYVYIGNNTFNDQLMTYVFENIYFIISMCLQYVECGFSIRQRIQCHLVFQEESNRIKFFYIIYIHVPTNISNYERMRELSECSMTTINIERVLKMKIENIRSLSLYTSVY